MGKLEQWRNFLCVLFPQCFYTEVGPGTAFDVILVDLMQFLAPMVLDKKFPQFDASRILRRLEERVSYYANRENATTRPQVKCSLVLMMDTPQWVPKNKAATQQSRDGKHQQAQSDDDEADEADDEAEALDELMITGPHMDASLYQELMKQLGGKEGSLFIDVNQSPLNGLKGATVWRSVNLKFQLYRLITHHLLHFPVGEMKTIIFDDGIAISTEWLAALRTEILKNNPDWQTKTAFEQECLVYQLMIQQGFHQRLILYDDRQFHRFPGSRIGEADIKIQAYIRPENGAKSYLCVNQDTDIIFILLLHMQYLLYGSNGVGVEVWIDTRSPSEKKDAPPKPYRYIDVKALYFSLKDFFQTEYPSVQHPVETFCFLVFSLRTDYTRPFAGCLAVSPRLVWNTFSELHSTVIKDQGYVQFTSKPDPKTLCRSKTTRYTSQLQNLLGDAVQYDSVSEQFQLNQTSIAQFYYYLCQQSVMTAREKIHLPTVPVKAALRSHELLLCGRELSERLNAYRNRNLTVPHQQQEQTEMEVELSPHQMFDALILPSAPLTGQKLKQYLLQNETVLARLSKKPTPEFYGVLTQKQMAARIARIAWYLKYCRHGWQQRNNHSDYTQQLDVNTSLWGWREEEVTVSNSTYYDARLTINEQTGGNEFKYYQVTESDQVIVTWL